MALITFIPPKTEQLYSLDRGLLYALLFWGLLVLIPCEALVLLVAVAVSQAGDRRPSRSQIGQDCAARLAAMNSRLLFWNSCFCSPVFGVLCALNVSSFFAAAPSHKVQLAALAWAQLAVSLLIHIPLGIHARNVVRFFEGAAALLLLQHALETDQQLSASLSPWRGQRGRQQEEEKNGSNKQQRQLRQQQQQQLHLDASEGLRGSPFVTTSSRSLLHAFVDRGLRVSAEEIDETENEPLLGPPAPSTLGDSGPAAV